MPESADILVVGSGIGGLSFALKAAQAMPHWQVVIITKDRLSESNTRYAQGGMAIVTDLDNDTLQQHVNDTLQAGDGLCDRAVAEFVAREAPERLHELLETGAAFDRESNGHFHLGREGGHSRNRIIHKGDCTGSEVERALSETVKAQKNIRVLEHHFAIDLITSSAPSKNRKHKVCHGVIVADLQGKHIFEFHARVVMLAAGGIGQIYASTTNPSVATGDAIAMAYRAGATISNMEFVQFHPTALFDENLVQSFLVTEAVRGAGAILRNRSCERFMHKYHAQQELACRDVVSRAIKSEMDIRGDRFVYLDCRHIDPERFKKEFPTVYNKCRELGIDISRDMIPVSPSAHYSCGGITTDGFARTSIENLYACGECACTGLHGANRLASNSLPEALVFAHRASAHIARNAANPELYRNTSSALPAWHDNFEESISDARVSLREAMNAIAIVCSANALESAQKKIRSLKGKLLLKTNGLFNKNIAELNNMLDVAAIIVQSSVLRTENKGSFFKEDNACELLQTKCDINRQKT